MVFGSYYVYIVSQRYHSRKEIIDFFAIVKLLNSIFRLCGFPPFYSNHGLAISPGMKKRIQSGQYDFPAPEWSSVSNDARDLIKGMLRTDPGQRLQIDDVMRNKWISVSLLITSVKFH